MKIQGEFAFGEPRGLVWENLLDPEVIARAIPGCDALTEVGEREYEGEINARVGPVQGRFQARFALSDIQVREGYRMTLKGSGSAGFVEGDGVIRLSDAENGTLMAYDFSARVGGRIASVGQRLLDSSARVIARQGLERLREEISARAAAGSEPRPDRIPAAMGSEKAYAAKVLGAILLDLIRSKAGLAAGLVLLVILILLFAWCSR